MEEDYNNNDDNNNKNKNNIIIQEASWLPGSSSFSGNYLHVGPFMTGLEPVRIGPWSWGSISMVPWLVWLYGIY